jgi:hypothetical protein
MANSLASINNQHAKNNLHYNTIGNREQAYVYALSSASLIHTVTKACSAGQLSKCHCALSPREAPPAGYKWGGCSDDVPFASSFSQQFTDSQWIRKKRRSKRSLVSLHNNAAGRQVLIDHRPSNLR